MAIQCHVQGLKDKGRSLDDIASDETVRKKPRTSFSGGGSKSSDFRPFQYEGKNFSDFARGKSTTLNTQVHNMSGMPCKLLKNELHTFVNACLSLIFKILGAWPLYWVV